MTQSFRWQPAILLGLLLHALSAHAQSGDGGSADGFQNSNLGAAGTGADGDSSSSANLSQSAIIAIAVVVAIVVVGGVTLAILFYLAKKRQWQVRKTIRRTATKAVRAMTPRTPAKMSFSPRSPRVDRQSPALINKDKGGAMDNQANTRDVEKGFTTVQLKVHEMNDQRPNSRKQGPDRLLNDVLRKNANLQLPLQTSDMPKSHFEIDSPKSPMWTKFLGRT